MEYLTSAEFGVSLVRKNGRPVITAIWKAFEGAPFMPAAIYGYA